VLGNQGSVAPKRKPIFRSNRKFDSLLAAVRPIALFHPYPFPITTPTQLTFANGEAPLSVLQ
jgi:hypothetical protein